MTFTGKIALVAGGTGGLGRAASLAFLKEGAEGPLAIVITDTGVTWQPAPTVAAGK